MSFIFLLLYLVCTFICPQEWVPAVYGWRLINITAIATFVALVFESMARKDAGLVKVPQNMLMLGLFASVLLSHIAHTYLGGMIDSFWKFLVDVVLFFVILNAVNTERKFKIALWFTVGLITLLAVQGIYQSKTGYGWAGQMITQQMNTYKDISTGQQIDSITNRINWVGIFNDPNDLALVLVIAVGIALAFLFGKTNISAKIFLLAILGVLFYGVFLTNSRGGYLALATTILFYFVKRSRKFAFGIIIGIICVAGIFVLGPSRLGLLSIGEESAYNRIDLWYEGLRMLKANPLFGVGFGMFQDKLPQTAHNSFVLVAAELGLVGLFFFVSLIYTSFKELSLVQKNNLATSNYALGLQSGLIGFCSAAFFLSRSYVILPYLLFALSGSLFCMFQHSNAKLQFEPSRKYLKNVILLTLGILILIYVIVKLGLL